MQLATRMQSLSDEDKLDRMLSESSSKATKRGQQIENENTAKRAKLDLEVHENKGQPIETMSYRSLTEDSDGHLDLVKLRDETADAAAEEILVPDVGISDFFALSEDKGMSSIINPLFASSL